MRAIALTVPGEARILCNSHESFARRFILAPNVGPVLRRARSRSRLRHGSPTTSAKRRTSSGLDVDLLCDLYGTIDLDAQIPNAALDSAIDQSQSDRLLTRNAHSP